MNKFLLISILFVFAQIAVFAQNYDAKPISNAQAADFLADDIKDAPIPYTNLNYNYESTFCIPIVLQISNAISTKDKNLYEGMPLKFTVAKTVFCRHKVILRQGDVVFGKVKYIISSGLNGIPYSIVVDDFAFKNLDPNKIKSEYQKDGFNRTYLVLPLKWSLTFLPPTGSLTNFIKGGHSKITPKDKITLYYFPDWK